MASNATGLTDERGQTPDWIEIRNLGSEEHALGGYYLSDDAADMARWRFPPDLKVPGDGFVIVFCIRAGDGR